MSNLKTVCVYCGSSAGTHPIFLETGRKLGGLIAEAGIRLVYGGGNLGIMGVLARAAVEGGADVVEIIPGFMRPTAKSLGAATEVILTQTMHERKGRMFDLADGFIALPGGIGTLDEVVETITWRQLKQHDKPVVIVNAENYWSRLEDLLHHIVRYDFAQPSLNTFYTMVDTPEEALPALRDALGETN